MVSGNIAADAGNQLRVAAVDDPAAFARTALVEALERAGVSVSASPTGPNASSKLPKKGSYKADDQIAVYESPPFSEYAKLILKVSHNYGANLNVCLMAVKAGSTDCNDGFPAMKSFFEKAGVDTDQVALADGRGGNPTDRFTPKAATDLLSYWLEQPQAKTFREMQPESGVNGGLATDCKDCPAKGKVFAKPGTVALPDYVNQNLLDNESLGGTWRQAPAATTSSTWWSTASPRRTSARSSRCSTTNPTSLPSCKKTPRKATSGESTLTTFRTSRAAR